MQYTPFYTVLDEYFVLFLIAKFLNYVNWTIPKLHQRCQQWLIERNDQSNKTKQDAQGRTTKAG